MTEEEMKSEDAKKAFQQIRAITDSLPPDEYAKMMELSKKEGGFSSGEPCPESVSPVLDIYAVTPCTLELN